MNKNIELEYNIVYIRPLVEHEFVIWSPFTVKDIEAIESVIKGVSQSDYLGSPLLYRRKHSEVG